MAVKKTEKIWHNGKFINWDDATLHVMAHVVNYGSSVFEGVRCYSQPKGPAIFRAQEHMQRLINSAKIYRMEVTYSRDELVSAMVELVRVNNVTPCYIRPLVLRGYGQLGVNPLESPIDVYLVNYEWGRYLGHGSDEGVDVCVSSWNRLAPNTMPAMSKAGANYMNSQLIKMEALLNGYVEGIGLDVNGYISEGSGENLFIAYQGSLYTPPLGNSILPGITRDAVIQLAKEMAIPVVEQLIPREMLYIADELFFSGTAAEITPIRSVDKIVVAKGMTGPITKAVQREFFNIVNGVVPDRFHWLTPVPVASGQPVSV
jgi:branched-chain amino acid aminotransferase